MHHIAALFALAFVAAVVLDGICHRHGHGYHREERAAANEITPDGNASGQRRLSSLDPKTVEIKGRSQQLVRTADDAGPTLIDTIFGSIELIRGAAPISYDNSVPADGRERDACELPSCDAVLRSRLYSERCGTPPPGWPLLVTGTPRSATTYASYELSARGGQMQDDWHRGNQKRGGRVSWIYAFEDDANFGPARTGGLKYAHVLHHVKDPLASVTSMCTEPAMATGSDSRQIAFLRRHIRLSSSEERPWQGARVAMEFYLHWHAFLDELKLPRYQIENVDFRDIFDVGGLEGYREPRKAVSHSANSREHHEKFTWREIYTIDPQMAARLWEMAHRFGYSYPDVNFDELTCLDYLPVCGGDGRSARPSDRCPPGEHPFPTDMRNVKARLASRGWVSSGCSEYKTSEGTFVGLEGLPREIYEA